MIKEGEFEGFGEPGFDEVASPDGWNVISRSLGKFDETTTCGAKKRLGDPMFMRMAFDEETDCRRVLTDCRRDGVGIHDGSEFEPELL